MTAYAYYNEIDPVACAVLKEAIALKIIAPGYVDSRSIKDVHVEDLYGFEQHHFFAGAGLWSVACRFAGWPDDQRIWTASCPCQGWSVAGKGLGFDDPRDLWPDLFRLWRAYRPAVGVGEITSGSAILPWLDRTCADLEREDYACRAVSVPACAVDAPNIRQRLWWSSLANTHGQSRQQISRSPFSDEAAHGRTRRLECKSDGDHRFASSDEDALAHPDSRGRDRRQEDAQRRSIGRDAVERPDADLEHAQGERWREGRPEHEFRSGRPAAARSDAPIDMGDAEHGGRQRRNEEGRRSNPIDASDRRSFWRDAEWIACADGKARRAEPGPESKFRVLADGLARVIDSRGYPSDLFDESETVDYSLLVPPFKGRADLWRLAGNSINPVLAAEVIKALMETIDGQPC